MTSSKRLRSQRSEHDEMEEGQVPKRRLRNIKTKEELKREACPLYRLMKTVLENPNRYRWVQRGLFFEAMEGLQALVGLHKAKEVVADQLRFLLLNEGKIDDHFLNAVITGLPGTGKSTFSRLLGKLYASLCPGRTKAGPFVEASREQLVGR